MYSFDMSRVYNEVATFSSLFIIFSAAYLYLLILWGALNCILTQ